MMEEEGLEELKLAKFKTHNLKRSFEEASSVASSVLMFTLKWRDLEDHYDNLHRGFEEKAQKLVLLRKGEKVTDKVLDERHGEIALKERELGSLQTQIEECSGQLEAKKKELALVEGLLGDCSLQFKSREKELELVKNSVKDCCTEFELKKELLFLVKKSVQECDEEREGKGKELISVKQELESLCEEVNLKKDELQSVLKLMETHQEELGSKERRLQVVQKMLDRFSIDAAEKMKEIDDLQSSLKQASKEFEMRRGDFDKLKQLDSELLLKTKKLEFLEDLTSEIREREQHVGSLRSLIEEYSEELVNKEKEYDSINKSIANCSAELKSKRKELESVKNSLTQLVKELNLRKHELNAVRRDAQEAERRLMSCNEALELKMRLKERQDDSLKESDGELKDTHNDSQKEVVEDHFQELDIKEGRIQARREAALELEEKRMDALRQVVEEQSKELELKKEANDRQKYVLNEGFQELQIREGELEARIKDLESKEREVDDVRRAVDEQRKELELKEKELNALHHVAEEQSKELEKRAKLIDSQKMSLEEQMREVDHFKELEPEEKQMATFPLAMEEERRESELRQRQVTAILHSEKEIGKMDQLLPAAAESQSACAQLAPMMDGSNLQALLIRLLMPSIIRTSPNPAASVLDAMRGFHPPYLKEDAEEFEIAHSLHIAPWARERALKLAHHRQTKISVKSQNQPEILGFLHLLASAFNVNEIQDLLDLVAGHNTALKLRQVLGIPRRASASRILTRIRPEQLDHTTISNASNTFSSAQVVTESLCVYEPTLMEGDIPHALQTSPDPAKFVLDVIQDKHSKYTKDREIKPLSVDASKKGKDAVAVAVAVQCMMIDRTIASVREIMHCIRDFNLECDASSQVLEPCIIKLEHEKAKLRGSAAAPTCTVLHMKRPCEALECPIQLPDPGHASASTNQQLGWGNKRVRTGGSSTKY